MDVARFERLRRTLEVERAQAAGINTTIYNLEGDRLSAAAELARLENEARRSHTANHPRADHAAFEAAIERATAAARAAVAHIDDQITALRQRQDEIHNRTAPLADLERRCRSHARSIGMALPGDPSHVATIAAGPQGREFGSGRGVAEPPPVSRSAAAAWGAPASARRLPAGVSFDMNSRAFNDSTRFAS